MLWCAVVEYCIIIKEERGAWSVSLWLLMSVQIFSEIKSLDYFGFFRWLNCSLINFCVLSSSQHLHACICIKHCNWLQFILHRIICWKASCFVAEPPGKRKSDQWFKPEVVHFANVLFYLISTQQRVHKKYRGRKTTVEFPLWSLCIWHNFYIIRLYWNNNNNHHCYMQVHMTRHENRSNVESLW